MKLVIAEKPSVAQSLAAVIGATARKDGYLEGNGCLLYTSGKSFSAKREIANCFLLTNDDVIICDPEAEYAPLVDRLHEMCIRDSIYLSELDNYMQEYKEKYDCEPERRRTTREYERASRRSVSYTHLPGTQHQAVPACSAVQRSYHHE